jgi:hypothetical protein
MDRRRRLTAAPPIAYHIPWTPARCLAIRHLQSPRKGRVLR